MAKAYKNLSEFIEVTFPDYYNAMDYKEEPTLQDYIEDATEAFNEAIDKIIKGEDEENKSS